MSVTNRPLKVFLCHSSNDKPAVRELYQKLRAEPWIQPWLDEEELYPGQDWNMEIEKAVEAADAIIVCLSNGSITKEGYVQKEIRAALDYADYKPEGTLFIIPIRLEECTPPKRLGRWQYADYFEGQRERALQRLLVSLRKRAESLNLHFEKPKLSGDEIIKFLEENLEPVPSVENANKLTLSNGMEFTRVPAGKFIMGSKSGENDETPQHTVNISHDYWMARFPVTNEMYNVYAKEKMVEHLVPDWKQRTDHPVVNVKFSDINGYCEWLNNILKSELPSDTDLRLPTESEWEKAARGTDKREFPWGNIFDKNKCNTEEGGKGNTSPVAFYSPHGDSPYGCADMAGNVWEWTHSLKMKYPYKNNDGREDDDGSKLRILRGGSFINNMKNARCAYRGVFVDIFQHGIGFRLVLAPPLRN
jgi:formylglycine-generating enzyme required for sulfatase activity